MNIVLMSIVALISSSFAFAGATHSWFGSEALPGIKVCQDQPSIYIQENEGPLQIFKFTGYGEDRSTQNFESTGGSFKLVIKNWGLYQFLVSADGTSYQLRLLNTHHGLCPGEKAP